MPWDWEFGGLQESLGLGGSRPLDHECGTANQGEAYLVVSKAAGRRVLAVWPPLPSCDLCSPPPLLPSLGLVLPPYSTFYLQANLSDQILQVKCKWPGPCLRPAPSPLPLHPGRPQAAQPAACGQVAPPAHSAHAPPPPGARRLGAPAIGKSVELCMLDFSQIWFQTILSWFPLRFLFLPSPPPCLPS